MIPLSPEDKLILSCIKIHPDSIELEKINSLIPEIHDWDYLISTIIDRGIGPLLFKKLPLLSNNTLIPQGVKTKLQQVYYKTVGRSTLLYEHFKKIADAFTKQNIPVVALKGIYLSEWLYRDIGLRQFSDIDLLVKEEDGEKSLAVLRSLGYKSALLSVTEFVDSKSEVIHYSPMVANGVSIEIHVKLHRNSESYAIDVSGFIQRSKPVTLNNVSVKAPELHDLIIHLCVHLDKHFRGGHVQFTCFNDLTNLLVQYETEIDWELFRIRCRENKCEQLVFGYLMLINKYFDAPLPEDILQQYSSLLIESDERLFLDYLHGFFPVQYFVSTHWQNISLIPAFTDKVRYICDLIFPPKAFMIPKYNIKNPHLVFFYYPYRYWVGVKGVVKMILRNK